MQRFVLILATVGALGLILGTGCGKDSNKKDNSKNTSKKKKPGEKSEKTTDSKGGGADKKLQQWGPNCKALFAAYDKACPKGTKAGQCTGFKFTVEKLRARPAGHKDNAMAEKMGCKVVKSSIDKWVAEKGKKK